MEFRQTNEMKEFDKLYKEMDKLYHEIALDAGLSDSAFLILYAICANEGVCMQKKICEEYSVSKQTVNSSVRKLARDGYIFLERKSGKDKQIHLTEAGEDLVKKYVIPVMEKENTAMLDMPKGERDELIRLTRKYIDCFKKNLK